jgi:hypothetical protein
MNDVKASILMRSEFVSVPSRRGEALVAFPILPDHPSALDPRVITRRRAPKASVLADPGMDKLPCPVEFPVNLVFQALPPASEGDAPKKLRNLLQQPVVIRSGNLLSSTPLIKREWGDL